MISAVGVPGVEKAGSRVWRKIPSRINRIAPAWFIQLHITRLFTLRGQPRGHSVTHRAGYLPFLRGSWELLQPGTTNPGRARPGRLARMYAPFEVPCPERANIYKTSCHTSRWDAGLTRLEHLCRSNL